MLEFLISQIPPLLFSLAIMFPAKYLHSRVLGCLAGMALGSLFVISSLWLGGTDTRNSVALFFFLAIAGFIWGQQGMKKK